MTTTPVPAPTRNKQARPLLCLSATPELPERDEGRGKYHEGNCLTCNLFLNIFIPFYDHYRNIFAGLVSTVSYDLLENYRRTLESFKSVPTVSMTCKA